MGSVLKESIKIQKEAYQTMCRKQTEGNSSIQFKMFAMALGVIISASSQERFGFSGPEAAPSCLGLIPLQALPSIFLISENGIVSFSIHQELIEMSLRHR